MFRGCPISYLIRPISTSSLLLLTTMYNPDSKDSSSLSLPTTDFTPSSLVSANYQPSLKLAGTAPFGTAISSAPQTTQEVVLTDVYVDPFPIIPVLQLILRAGSTPP